ncbi:MAG: hypothetical protein SNJ82_14395 [Gemmataceae bacterium]
MKTAREEQDLTQEEFAHRADNYRTYLCDIGGVRAATVRPAVPIRGEPTASPRSWAVHVRGWLTSSEPCCHSLGGRATTT